jgi:hypothetical protein
LRKLLLWDAAYGLLQREVYRTVLWGIVDKGLAGLVQSLLNIVVQRFNIRNSKRFIREIISTII